MTKNSWHVGKIGRRKAVSLLVVGHFAFFLSCTDVKEHTAPAIHDRDSVSMMTSYGVNTLISDSGIIKYRIVTERWDVNVIKNPSRWSFEKGVFFEQFDEKFHVQAYIQADTAWYYDQKKLWLYSNVFSKVTTPERSMEGTRFLSDEQMRHYTVSNSKGSFEREDMTGENREEEKPQTNPADTISQEPQFMRPQAQKHRKSDI